MDNIKWKNIFQFKDTMFFAQNNSTKVFISDGLVCVREYSKENVSGCAYNNETLWLSTENSNTLIAVDSENNEELIPILDYDNISIIKMVTGQESMLILEGSNAKDKSLFVFDCNTKEILFVLPIQEDFIDIVITSYKTALLLCEERRRVPARYSDEVDDVEILFWAELEWNQESTEVIIKKSMKLYIDYNYETDDGDYGHTILYSKGLRFPLFDCYLYHWLEQKSFSLNGKYVVYYSEDIQGIVIGNPVGGKIYRIIALPDAVANPENEFFYNYHVSELVVITKANEIKRYVINCTSEVALNRLNTVYNEAFLNKTSLSVKGDMTFTNILYRAIGSCVCMPVGPVRPRNRIDDKMIHISLTVKTPISGKLLLKQTQKILDHFNCGKEEFVKTIEFDVTGDSFDIVFKTDAYEKEFFFSVHTCESFYIDVEKHLALDEVVQCCNRNIARRKLQTYPTDIYATYQLGYVGTEEDYNFLLSILEDHYCGSSLSHGENSERLWMCVRSISNLSFRYKRKDAIPFLIEACKHIENKRVWEMVQDCCSSLKSYNSFREKPYRVDLLVRTDKIIHIYANSEEKWITKIDGTLGYDERIDWCYLRTSKKQIKLIFETSLGNQEIMIDIGDNNPQYRQVIDVETAIFSCDMAKRILDELGERMPITPEGITELEEDFTLLNGRDNMLERNREGFDVANPKYSIVSQQQSIKGDRGMKIRVPHFKIGITFSGKYRKQFVEPFCDELLKLGYNKDDIFYDAWHDVLINGVHGDSILRQIYFKNCDCVVVLLSPDYKKKNWTGHIEWSAVKELINTGNDGKICLLRVDSADIGSIDGLYKNQTIAKAIDDMSAPEIATFIHQKYNMLV